MAIRDLTVKERILLHLFDYNRFADDFEVPEEVTQSGIAKGAGFRVQHVTQYVKPLIEEGLVEETTKHIERKPRRRKAYFLTGRGRQHVASQRTELLEENIPFQRMGGELKLLPLSQIYLEERRGTSLVELLGEADANGHVSETVESPAPGIVDFSQETPLVDVFYGREDELREVVDALDQVPMVVVTGIAGIGKTTLGSKVCEVFRGEKALLWRRIRSWERATDLAFQLGSFLKALGKPRLSNYLDNTTPKDLSRLEQILRTDLPGVEALVVLDDAHAASEDAEAFLAILFDLLRRTEGTSTLLLSRTVPGFYSRRDVEIEGSLVEVSLGGLDEASGRALLVDAGFPESALPTLLELSGGNPLFLKLLASSGPRKGVEEGWKTVETYIAEEIEPMLTDGERSCLQAASFYEIAVPYRGLLLEKGTGKRTLLSLQRKGFLDEVGQGDLVLHDFLRSYFQESLSSERRRSLTGKVVEWLQDEAQSRKAEGRRWEAISLLENALSVEVSPSRRAVNLERVARLRLSVVDIRGAIAPLTQALEETNDVHDQARLLERLAFSHSSNDNWDQAKEELERGLRLLPNDPSVEAGMLMTLKAAWNYFGREYDVAWNLLSSVLDWRQQFPSAHHLWARAFRYRGWIHMSDPARKDLSLAQADFEAALKAGQAYPSEPQALWVTYSDLALVAVQRGQVREAFEYLDRSDEIAKKSGYQAGDFAVRGGYLSECLGNQDAAEAAYEETYQWANRHDAQARSASIHRRFALLYWRQGRPVEAREAMTQFLRRWGERLKDMRPYYSVDAIGSLALLVKYCLASGDEILAVKHHQEAQDLMREDPSDLATFFTTWAEGMLQSHRTDWNGARSSYENAHRLRGEADRWEDLQWDWPCTGIIRNEFLLDYGKLLAALGETEEARGVFLGVLGDAKALSRAPLISAAEQELRAVGEMV